MKRGRASNGAAVNSELIRRPIRNSFWLFLLPTLAAFMIGFVYPIRTYFRVVFPMLRPTMISVGILEIMWIWNDYLLPYLSLDRTKYMTIPIHIQYLQGSYGSIDLGAIMALITMSIIPVIVFYLTCQKHIIKGVAAGAVKG